MLRRYWPPTSKNASLIWPSEQCLTAFIRASKTFPQPAAVSLRRRRAAGATSACPAWKPGQPVQLALFFGLGGPGQLDFRGRGAVGVGVGEDVHADYRFRTRRRCCDLRFGRMGWLRRDRGLCPFARST